MDGCDEPRILPIHISFSTDAYYCVIDSSKETAKDDTQESVQKHRKQVDLKRGATHASTANLDPQALHRQRKRVNQEQGFCNQVS